MSISASNGTNYIMGMNCKILCQLKLDYAQMKYIKEAHHNCPSDIFLIVELKSCT